MRGSAIRESHRAGDVRVQDPYSIRCAPQVHGAVRDVLEDIEAKVAVEMNAVTDNPLVFPGGEADDGEPSVLSGGNFQRPAHGVRGGLPGHRTRRARLDQRAADREADQHRVLRAAAVPRARRGPQFRVHDGASHRGGAGGGEQSGVPPRLGRFDPDVGGQGGSRLDGHGGGAQAAHGGCERPPGARHRAGRRRAGGSICCVRCGRASGWKRCIGRFASGSRSGTTTGRWPAIWSEASHSSRISMRSSMRWSRAGTSGRDPPVSGLGCGCKDSSRKPFGMDSETARNGY